MFFVYRFRYILRGLWEWICHPQRSLTLWQKVTADIKQTLAWSGINPGPKNKEKKGTVVFASFLPLAYSAKIEGFLSTALKIRGWNVQCLYGDMSGFVERYHRRCFLNKGQHLHRYMRYGDYLRLKKFLSQQNLETIADIKRFMYKNCALGIHVLATLSAHEKSGNISFDKPKIYRWLLYSCMLADAAERFIETVKPQKILAVEKGFVGCCEIFWQALNKKVDYIQWCGCHEPDSIMMKRYKEHNVRAHPFSIAQDTWVKIKERKTDDERVKQLVMEEFENGYKKGKWFEYKKLSAGTQMLSRDELINLLGLEPTRKTVVIFSHILNDANLFYGEDLFEGGFREWLIETVRISQANNRVNWVLKIHPANVYRRKMSGQTGEYGEILALKEEFGSIPAHLKILYPDTKINPLSIYKMLDYAVTVRGTVGAEVPCFGKTAITAGTGRYSALGFTCDSNSKEEYLKKIAEIDTIHPPDKESIRLALLHAHLFFRARPARYNTFATDVYPKNGGVAFSRDLRFDEDNVQDVHKDNQQINEIADWISDSSDEDFLASTEKVW